MLDCKSLQPKTVFGLFALGKKSKRKVILNLGEVQERSGNHIADFAGDHTWISGTTQIETKETNAVYGTDLPNSNQA